MHAIDLDDPVGPRAMLASSATGTPARHVSGWRVDRRWIGSAALALSIAVFCRAAPAGVLETFRSDYPAAAARLEEAYSHVKVTGTRTRIDQMGQFASTTHVLLMREGSAFRADTTVLKLSAPDAPTGGVSSSGGTSELCYRMYKAPKATDFAFSWFGPKEDFEGEMRPKLAPLFAPYSLPAIRMVDFLKDDSVKVVSAENAQLDGRPAIKVITHMTLKPGTAPPPGLADLPRPEDAGVWKREFFFDPQTWALLAWTLHPGDKLAPSTGLLHVFQGRIAYVPDSVPPRVKSCESWMEFPGHNIRTNGDKVEVETMVFGPIPKSEFTATAAGAASVPAAHLTRPATERPSSAAPRVNSGREAGTAPRTRAGSATPSSGAATPAGSIGTPLALNGDGAAVGRSRTWLFGALALALALAGVVLRVLGHRPRSGMPAGAPPPLRS